MTDADTPRVPELWWSPSEIALWEKDEDGFFCPDYYPIKGASELPDDAVKLGDVEAAYDRGFADGCGQGHNDLHVEISNVVAKWRQVPTNRTPILIQILQQVEDILDREPGDPNRRDRIEED